MREGQLTLPTLRKRYCDHCHEQGAATEYPTYHSEGCVDPDGMKGLCLCYLQNDSHQYLIKERASWEDDDWNDQWKLDRGLGSSRQDRREDEGEARRNYNEAETIREESRSRD